MTVAMPIIPPTHAVAEPQQEFAQPPGGQFPGIMVHTVSYLHCGTPTGSSVSHYAPCLERKESGESAEDPQNHIGLIQSKQIEGDWYIYEFKNYS